MLTFQLHLEDLGKQEVAQLCLQLRRCSGSIYNQIYSYFKDSFCCEGQSTPCTIQVVHSQTSSYSSSHSSSHSSSPCVCRGSGLWFPIVRTNRAQPGCWQHPPKKDPTEHTGSHPKGRTALAVQDQMGGAIVLGTVSLSTISRPSQIALGVSGPLLLWRGDGGGSAELREGLTLLAHKLQPFRGCLLKGS